ncbi:MAG: Crp/Fnr family transcriptional regulator [Candidatus Andeanibacterium colombiense]|uniref:Crp/Fnr family transcriptional regulator n=1 Tax=Candidatus Andeanibacterium colombiense TaxID=3121345 RepID=A0AAJ5X4V9_9SPHN|nr:MAG: Crp/Fnr family transcriptional regulator [Sphingomonadaceae bacterium]
MAYSVTDLAASHGDPAALRRFQAISPLDDASIEALRKAIDGATPTAVRRELMSEGQEIFGKRILVSGWAARVRLLADGRRQLISFLVPGDLFGNCGHSRPLAVSTVLALTAVAAADVPEGGNSQSLREAYEVSRAIEEAHLLAQITRLGRLSALERIADLLLELCERLTLAGLAQNGRFLLPLTQEVVADALGLTSVHLSRTLQTARRNGDFEWRDGQVHLPDPERLARKVGRLPVRVSNR